MARQKATVGPDGIHIPLKHGDAKGAPPAQLAGTLVLTEKTADGERPPGLRRVGASSIPPSRR